MDEKYRKTLRTILIVLIAACIVIAAAFLLLLAPAFVETTMPVDSYVIEIDGPGSLAVNGTATVMVPIPANADGEPVMPEGALTDRQVGGWQAEVRETPYGKMLAFTTTERYAPDILLPSGVRETKKEPRLLAPVIAVPGTASVAEFCRSSGGTYTTVVFVDGFVPASEDATPITFELEYRGGAGMKHLVTEDTWTTTVHATVAGNRSGFVQVPAEYRVIAGGVKL
jgi:hypothetical protein